MSLIPIITTYCGIKWVEDSREYAVIALRLYVVALTPFRIPYQVRHNTLWLSTLFLYAIISSTALLCSWCYFCLFVSTFLVQPVVLLDCLLVWSALDMRPCPLSVRLNNGVLN